MPAPRRPTAARATSGASSPGYDIYLATDDGKIEKKLTGTPGLRCRGHRELEDRQDCVHVAGFGRSGPLDHENGRLGKEAHHRGGGLRRRRRVLPRWQDAGVARATIRSTPETHGAV